MAASSPWIWLSLAVALCCMTFGVLTVSCFLLALLGALGVAYHYGNEKSSELYALFEGVLETPNTGIPMVMASMENTVRVKNFDKRMTGAASMDSILQEVLEYALRDYINVWYRPLSDHDQFPVSVWQCAQRVVITFASRTKEIDWLPYFTSQVVDDFASHIRLYRRAADRVLMAKAGVPTSVEDAFFDLEVEMEKNMCRDSVCTDPAAEKQYLQDLSEVLLFLLLPPEDFKNKLFRYILREVLVNGVFRPTIDLFSDPDYINQNVSWLCKESALTNDTFISVIKTTDREEELEAVKEKVEQDVYRWRSKDTGGNDDMSVKQTLNSLLFVKATCEARLRRLQGGEDDDDTPEDTLLPGQHVLIMSVDDIITNNMAVHAFIEFLSSTGLQQYLFFYLNVDGYRTVAEQQAKSMEEWKSGGSDRRQPDLECLRQAATILYDQYLSEKASRRIRVDENALKRVSQCIKKKLLTDSVFDEVQAEVYVRLHGERFYEAFLRSPYYAKLLSDMNLLDEGDVAGSDDDAIIDDLLVDQVGDDDTVSIDSESSGESPIDPQSGVTLAAHIAQIGVAKDKNKSYAVFAITVKKKSSDGLVMETWDVYRRFSDFYDLHMIVFDSYGSIAGLILPGKTPFRNMNKSFLERRRKALDAYLQALLNTEVIQSHAGLFELVYKFLCPKIWEKHKSDLSHKVDTLVNPFRSSVRQMGSVVKNVPDTVADSFTGFSQMFRLRSKTAIPRNSEKVGAGLDPDDGENIPLRIMLLLMDEVFGLKNKNQWFRRRIAVILRQIIKATYGDKINRKIVEQVNTLTSAEQMAEYVRNFRDAFWPGGVLAEPRPVRDSHTTLRTRVVCKAKMLGSISDQLRHLMGNEAIRKGVHRVFDMLQMQTLNKRLVYVVLEGVIQTMFPDHKFQEIFIKLHSKSTRVQQTALPNDLKFDKN